MKILLSMVENMNINGQFSIGTNTSSNSIGLFSMLHRVVVFSSHRKKCKS